MKIKRGKIVKPLRIQIEVENKRLTQFLTYRTKLQWRLKLAKIEISKRWNQIILNFYIGSQTMFKFKI